MANFLRDQQITNMTINEDKIKQISALFTNRAQRYNYEIAKDSDESKKALPYFTIRFDGKGYRVYTLEDLLLHFQQAKEVERIIFSLETGQSILTNRNTGTVMELRLDQKNPNACTVLVTSDDRDWVDASFSAIQDILSKCKNKNGWVRTAWTELVVQITGVAFGFFISLWAAMKLSSKLIIENSFIISFLFVLLIFSNTWAYLNNQILSLFNYYFPSLNFHRPDKDRISSVLQTIITAILGAIVLGILGLLWSYFMTIFNSLITKN